MKLPEPIAVMDADGDIYKELPMPNWHPPHINLYTEYQLRAEIERREAVLRVALEALEEKYGWVANRLDAIHAINKVLE